ncbi:5-histidylcysteine sulfoxide synthase [Crocosphaera sp. UHCC 0190]|uniref:5-histidylcysteine sulfoxide synthase n=1 Tax=Crocosphaera sp. UHCC 0190 TaxID=3110246 RepID=UPI002B21085C|nr:5-histidylcysteine sulfoxide synthase [Crocosphaera sp. UHCC 0190]MEA5510315.1 5-histidylcysteine sulfoxide synthase [Crocosphaera sp. UHCC 0190]
MNNLKSNLPFVLNDCSEETILTYFQNTWQLEDILLKSIQNEETFYINPDPLRNPLIFYLGHSAVFYINKLISVGLLEKRLNPDYEILFELGVDPDNAEQLNAAITNINWPKVETVWDYRNQAYHTIIEVIKNTPLNLPIHQNHPLWGLMMAIEHQRIHFETSSMLIRQLPVEKLKQPQGWQYAPSQGVPNDNKMILVQGGTVKLGKSEDFPLYGWDSEYGDRFVNVESFFASQSLITNAEFKEFVNSNGYENQEYWDEKSWQWKQENNVKHPKFWQIENNNYHYRAMFDNLELPLDWPVEVNYYEAMAYCRWKGSKTRLMSEAEWNLATYGAIENQTPLEIETIHNYNLNLKFGSPSPVGLLKTAESASGLWDLRGNVWEWLEETFNPLPGFKPHFLYEDNAAPFFDNNHKMMLGGAWVTQGTEALRFYRNWFRPNFYQHAGFRIVQNQS